MPVTENAQTRTRSRSRSRSRSAAHTPTQVHPQAHTTDTRAAQPDSRSLYATHFSNDELERILTALADPTIGLDGTIDATYVLLDRIIGRLTQASECEDENAESEDEGARDDVFLKLVNAHNQTTRQIASLLRSRQVLSRSTADSLTGHVAAALDQLAEQLQVQL
jgi:hypothetical protein